MDCLLISLSALSVEDKLCDGRLGNSGFFIPGVLLNVLINASVPSPISRADIAAMASTPIAPTTPKPIFAAPAVAVAAPAVAAAIPGAPCWTAWSSVIPF